MPRNKRQRNITTLFRVG